MMDINCNNKPQFNMTIYGYNKRQVDEYIYELLTYCFNLEQENEFLKEDLFCYCRQNQLQQLPNTLISKLEEKEYSILLGLTLQEDLLDYEENIVLEKNTVITSSIINSLVQKGLYGELIAAVDLNKGVGNDAK